ncbi:hypothetical protein ACFWU5_25265 [Nocardia sp. NPDC058640]|uniref:hypothetical protein n=1 Tax=Nocardia sp. NPDC058640 TaxID=3346571 RepID=UPI003648B45B
MGSSGPWEDESSGSPFGPPLDELGPDPAAVAGLHEQAPTAWRPADPESAPDAMIPAPPPQFRAPAGNEPMRATEGLPDWSAPARPIQQARREPPPPMQARPPLPQEPHRESPPPSRDDRLGEPPPSWDDDPMAEIFGLGKSAGRPRQQSSWDEDDLFDELHSASTPATGAAKSGRRGIGLIALGAVATVAIGVAAGMTYVVVTGQDNEPETVVVAATSPPTTTRTAGPLPCVEEQRGNLTVGRGPGDIHSGPGVILGFEYAFYTDRDGEKARSFVAPEADTVGSAPTIQGGIDKYIPVGTTYCAQISQIGPDSYELDLTERRPGGSPADDLLYTQLITTTVRDGRTLIASIAERGQ